jgi:hypothetical protein
VQHMPRAPHIKVAFISLRSEKASIDRARRRLVDGTPDQFDNVYFFAADDPPSSFDILRSFDFVVVDEWWGLKREFRDYLARELRVIAALGTVRYGAEFPISGQQNDHDIEREIERRVRDRLYEEIQRYTNTRLLQPMIMPRR